MLIFKFQVKCHYGSICSVTRSPHFIKNYMTVGDWQAKIWTEDNKETSIVWTKEYFAQLTCGRLRNYTKPKSRQLDTLFVVKVQQSELINLLHFLE